VPNPSRPRGLRNFVRCAGSSIVSVAAEFVVLTLLVSVCHVYYLLASLASTIGYLILNFILNRRWAFRAGHAPVWPQVKRHLGSAAIGMALGTTLLWVFVHSARLPYQLGWAASGCVVFSAWTWPINRRIYAVAVDSLEGLPLDR
jgi:putative flippase GtrA